MYNYFVLIKNNNWEARDKKNVGHQELESRSVCLVTHVSHSDRILYTHRTPPTALSYVHHKWLKSKRDWQYTEFQHELYLRLRLVDF